MTEYATCDMCGRTLRRIEFFSVLDEVRMVGFCKRCAHSMFEDDEEDDLEYFALTARFFRKKQPRKAVSLPHPTYEQLSLFNKKDGQ